MIAINLTENQKAQLRAEKKRSRNVQIYRRATALLAIDEGESVIRMAELLGVTRQCIYNWIAAYGSGEEGMDLRDAPRAGRPRLVTKELQEVLANAFRQTPAALGLDGENWTIKLLQRHLHAQCGRMFSAETLRRHVGLLGYVWRERRYVLEGKRGDGEIGKAANAGE